MAAAEMAIGGGHGLEVELGAVPVAGSLDDATVAFSESLGRLIVEVDLDSQPAFETELGAHPWARVGTVRTDPIVRFLGRDGSPFIAAPVGTLQHAWRGHVEGVS